MNSAENNARWSGPFFWGILVSVAAVVVLIAAAMNYLVDPFDIYGNRYLPASQLNNYRQKLELFDKFQPPPSALILGSSRAMTCDPELVSEITGERCFNFWLPGSGAETLYAVMNVVGEESDVPINLVIVGVGVETVHPALPIQPEARYIPRIARWFVHDPHGRATTLERIGLLFTMDQTIRSAGVVYSVLRGRAVRQTSEAGMPRLDYRDDGYAVQAQAEAQLAAGTFDLDAKIEARLRRRRFTEQGLVVSGWTGPSETRKRYWEEFLNLCRERNVRVYAFMTPAHPRLWSLLQELDAGPVYREVSDYFNRTVTEMGGTFRDYTLLESFGGDPQLFYDEMHMRKPNCDELIRNLLASYERSGTK